MLLEWLERFALPVMVVVLGSGGALTTWITVRQRNATVIAPHPPDAPDPETTSTEEVTRWLLAEAGETRTALTETRATLIALQQKFDRVIDEVPPYVRAVEAGDKPAGLSPLTRQILGVDSDR